jgi:DNA (cytosine-5)-methyltransferase 1
MPKQKPSESRQDYETPDEFMSAVAMRFGPIGFDLAAQEHNAKRRHFFSPEQDSLAQDWVKALGYEWGWLNPPFKNMRPWVSKCREESARGARVLSLAPAAVGSEWFGDLVISTGWVQVLFLAPRLKFVGESDPYPKDLMLMVWDRRYARAFDRWRFDLQHQRFDECRREFEVPARGEELDDPAADG